MTLRHFAYELSPGIECRLSNLGPGDGTFPALLRKCAVATVTQSNSALDEFLVAIRYDPGWLANEADTPSRQAHWALLCLAWNIKSIASLGRTPPLHHLILAAALPGFGWSQTEIQFLLRGQPLGDYLRRLGLDFDGIDALNDIAGCLNSVQREALSQKLLINLDSLLNATDRSLIGSLERALHPLFQDDSTFAAHRRTSAAFRAAIAMLSSPSSHQHLLLILD